MPRHRSFDHAAAVAAYDTGESVASIAARHNVSREAIRQALRRAGRITRRPMTDAQLASHLAVRVMKLSPEGRRLFHELIDAGE